MAHADKVVLLWINGWVGSLPSFDGLVEWLVGDYLVPAVLGLALMALWFGGPDSMTRLRYQIGVLTALSAMALASWAVFISNAVYFRDRPFVDLEVSLLFYRPVDSSMPSNSAAAFIGLAAAVWGFDRRAGTVLLVVAGVHAFLRVYVGVHYPSDVIVGGLIGVAAAVVAFKLRDLLGPIPTMVIKAARILCVA